MNTQTLPLYGLLSFIVALTAPCFASEPHLFVDWPADWEFRQTAQDEQQALHVQGRQRARDRVLQELAMTVIDTDAAREPVTNASIKDLIQRLRRRLPITAGVSEVQPFAKARGYYFVVTDRRIEKSPPYKHRIEGVMLDSGYLMEFALQSNDAHAPDTLTMLSALEKFTIR